MPGCVLLRMSFIIYLHFTFILANRLLFQKNDKDKKLNIYNVYD